MIFRVNCDLEIRVLLQQYCVTSIVLLVESASSQDGAENFKGTFWYVICLIEQCIINVRLICGSSQADAPVYQ